MVTQTASVRVRSVDKRIVAVLEVLAVFVATFALIKWTALLPIGQLQWRFLAYAIMIAVPLGILLLTRRDLQAYGLDFNRVRDQLNLALALFPVVAVEGAISGWLLPMFIPNAIIRWEGAAILSLVSVPLFLWAAWILRRRPAAALAVAACVGLLPLVQSSTVMPQQALSFLFYLLFLGPGEEFLFRGYIQSRLNAAFGRPYRFWGVSFGWGLLISALLFGLMHVINRFNPFLGRFDLYIWWGVWTVFGGLIFGYIREKAGSVLPTAILHGLPQAIASLMLGFFAVR